MSNPLPFLFHCHLTPFFHSSFWLFLFLWLFRALQFSLAVFVCVYVCVHACVCMYLSESHMECYLGVKHRAVTHWQSPSNPFSLSLSLFTGTDWELTWLDLRQSLAWAHCRHSFCLKGRDHHVKSHLEFTVSQRHLGLSVQADNGDLISSSSCKVSKAMQTQDQTRHTVLSIATWGRLTFGHLTVLFIIRTKQPRLILCDSFW